MSFRGGERSGDAVKLYRIMRIDADGKPMVGTRRNMLGVRPTDPANTVRGKRFDVPAVRDDDSVIAGANKGLSAVADRWEIERFATEQEPIWELDAAGLSASLLAAVHDPPANNPAGTHHVIGPIQDVTLAVFQSLLASTRDLWFRV